MIAEQKTTYTWACDMCGNPAIDTTEDGFFPPKDLTRFEFHNPNPQRGPRRVDLCGTCMEQPIKALDDWLDVTSGGTS